MIEQTPGKGGIATPTEVKKVGMKLSDYEITLRRVLYDPGIWLKTPQAIARWLKHCADNAHTRFAQFAADEEAA